MVGIPRILHQIWYNFCDWGKEKRPPEKYRRLTHCWLKLNPDWSYILWTESSSIEFLHQFYPLLIKKFLGYKRPIQRVDFFRWVVLYHFGGVFADMDCVPLKPLDQLCTHKTNIVVMPSDGWVTNALIIASAFHPAILKVIHGLPTNDPWFLSGPSVWAVFQTTGPSAIRRILHGCDHIFFDDKLLCHTPGTPEQAKEFYERGYLAQHLGDGSWDFKRALVADIARIVVCLLSFIFLVVLFCYVNWLHSRVEKGSFERRPASIFGAQVPK